VNHLLRPLSQFEAYARGVETASPKADKALRDGVKGQVMSGETEAPAYELPLLFPYQSYFSTSLGAQAILPQPANNPIVPSTQPDRPVQVAGYALGLHPSSETPVAVQFFTGAQQGASATYRLKPGEIIRPHGRPKGPGHSGQFSGFTYGLPFGWLGGGSALLVVFRTADATAQWFDHNEVIYHRVRLPIVAAASLPATAALVPNWPTRFPWPNAVSALSSAAGITQRGQPALAVHPTRTLMRLASVTGAALLAPATMRIYFRIADALAQEAFGTAGEVQNNVSDTAFIDYVWGSFAQQAGAAAPYATSTPMTILTGEMERLACNDGAIVLSSDAATLNDGGALVDFVRYGRL